MARHIIWTEEKLAYLREHYPTEPANDIAEVIGCTDTAVSWKAKRLGIMKSPDFNKYDYIGRYVRKGTKNSV